MGRSGARRRYCGARDQPIAKAVGIRGVPPYVFDATGGLGRDAFLLACLGCRVVAVERSPILAALVREALARAAVEPDPKLHVILSRITWVEGDSRDVLTAIGNSKLVDCLRDSTLPPSPPDVVYLDPMYPTQTKSALAKKEMRICRELVGDDPDAGELFDISRAVAGKRVVVKRSRLGPALAYSPTIVFRGSRVRYDVYITMKR